MSPSLLRSGAGSLRLRRHRLAAVGAGLLLAASAGTAAAAFVSTLTIGGNTLSTGSWTTPVYYLHNNPTPPVANTKAQANLAMDSAVPTASTLYKYATDVTGDKGRAIKRSTALVTDTDLRNYQNWLTPALSYSLSVSGNVTIGLWSQPAGNTTSATAILWLRVCNSAGTSCTAIGSTTYTNASWATGASFVQQVIAIPVAATTIPAGDRLELRIMVPSASKADLVVAYDTTTNQSVVRLP